MPNWCENYLRLEVPTKQDADIIDAVLNENRQVYEDYRKDIPEGRGLPFWGEQPLGLLGYLMPEPDYTEGDKKLAEDGINHTFPDWYSFKGKRTTGGLRRAGNPIEKNFERELVCNLIFQ